MIACYCCMNRTTALPSSWCWAVWANTVLKNPGIEKVPCSFVSSFLDVIVEQMLRCTVYNKFVVSIFTIGNICSRSKSWTLQYSGLTALTWRSKADGDDPSVIREIRLLPIQFGLKMNQNIYIYAYTLQVIKTSLDVSSSGIVFISIW